MNRYVIPSVTATVLLAAGGSWALAENNPMGMSSNTGSTPSSQADVSAPPTTDIAPFHKAKLSLSDAIHSAQQQQQGKAVEARFEMWDGQPAYFVRTCAHNRIWEGRINANSGQVIGQPQTFTANQVTRELNDEAKAVTDSKTSLTQAVKDAEQQQGGKAIMAKVQLGSSGKPSYDIDVVTNGQLRTAMVDASTGKVG